MFKKLDDLYLFVDQTIASIYQQHPEAINCKPGCADCCHAVFDVSFIEAAMIASSLDSHADILNSQQQRAEQAALEYEKLIADSVDPSTARIRCPLLGEDDLCLVHPVRPINCRTYGTPTVINGKAHVCGLSGFASSRSYPTVDLAPLQVSLQEYSTALVGESFGAKRYPIAWIILRTNYFLPR